MSIWIWLGFLLFVSAMLALDLGVFHRKEHVVRMREALCWTAGWVSLALLFVAVVYFLYEKTTLVHPIGGEALSGSKAAIKFLTGYIVEYTLSMDNIFIIALIFAYFRVPEIYQHRVLFWGIVGAAVMRGVMIALGSVLIHRFDWVVYVFGVLLIATAVKMLITDHDQVDPERNPLVRLARRVYPISPTFEGNRFFTRLNGRRAATPLFLALIVVETTDLLFAVDSIPAIFSITRDPFLVFTSNIFAILGLRSLYFALAGLMRHFRYLKVCLVFLLAYVGVKMLLSHHYPIEAEVSLAIIAGILSVGILASVLHKEPPAHGGGPPGSLS